MDCVSFGIGNVRGEMMPRLRQSPVPEFCFTAHLSTKRAGMLFPESMKLSVSPT